MSTININNSTIDPLMNYYFDKVQEYMKKLLIEEPYSIPQSSVDSTINLFFTHNNINMDDIKDIVNGCFSRNDEFDVCAKSILDKYYSKYRNNDYTLKHKIMENNNKKIQYDGLNGFSVFIKIMGALNLKFIYTKQLQHLNTEGYDLFLYTNSIMDYTDFKDEIEDRKSLETTISSFTSIMNTQNLSVYMGLKNFILSYGFYDVDNNTTTKTGECPVNSKVVKSLTSYTSFTNVRQVLNINLSNLSFLNKIKQDFKEYLIKSKPILVLNDKVMVKKFTVNDFKNPATTYEQYLTNFSNWILKLRYNSKINYSVELDGNNVNFYISIKS